MKIYSGVIDFAMASTLYSEQKGKFPPNASDCERPLAWLQLRIGKKTRVIDISDSIIAAAFAARRDEGVSNATVNRSVTEVLRAILRRCERV